MGAEAFADDIGRSGEITAMKQRLSVVKTEALVGTVRGEGGGEIGDSSIRLARGDLNAA